MDNRLTKAVMIGAGQRGTDVYGEYALRNPEKLRFLAVAEPDPKRRIRFASQHSIPPDNQFTSWEPMLERPCLGEVAFVCTQDWQHLDPALKAMRVGYHVLLEKPMATTVEACRQLVLTSETTGQRLYVAHVLRYTKHFQKMREIVRSGILGEIITVHHRENVSWWHMAHSYVRGNWRNRDLSSPMILAKCCHDFDILTWVLDRRCESLSSVGGLTHFREDKAPKDAPQYCLDGCSVSGSCAFYAPFIYIDLVPLWREVSDTGFGLIKAVAQLQLRAPSLLKVLGQMIPVLRNVSEYEGWPRSVVVHDPTPENVLEALSSGPYGRCVYRCDNDVVDHQVVVMEFEGGLSVTLSMHGHAHLEGRTTRIQGSRAQLEGFFGVGGAWIEVKEHRSNRSDRYDTSSRFTEGHGGGDRGLMDAFLKNLHERNLNPPDPSSTARESLESHLMAFAADRARLERSVVAIRELRSF